MNREEEIEKIKEVVRKGFKKADCRNEYTKEPYPYFDSQITAIANGLYDMSYRKITPNVDFVVRCSDLVNIREKAYKDARKETAKEIWEEVLSFCKENYRSIPDCSWNLDPFLKRKNIIMQVLYERMKSFVRKYGVEVDDDKP